MAEVTLDEMETQLAEPAAPASASDIKLEADDVPDVFKGKSVQDVIEMNRKLMDSLRISEEARLNLKSSLESRTDAPRTVEPEPAVELTREQIQTLFSEDPIKAIEYMQGAFAAKMDKHLNDRFKPVVDSNVSNAEEKARAKYAAEFELFGDQIAEVKKQINPNVLSTDKGWKDIISYVRGQDDNIDKLMAFKQNGRKKTPDAARSEQVIDAGFTPRAVARPTAATGEDTAGLDATQLEVCKVLGIEPRDYKKYM